MMGVFLELSLLMILLTSRWTLISSAIDKMCEGDSPE